METAHSFGNLDPIQDFSLEKSSLRCQFDRESKKCSFRISSLGFICGVDHTVNSEMEQIPFPYFEDMVSQLEVLRCSKHCFKSLSPKLSLNYCSCAVFLVMRSFMFHIKYRHIHFNYSFILFQLSKDRIWILANLTHRKVSGLAGVNS